jgi:hypothetical protein
MATLAAEHDRLEVPDARPAHWSENAVCICNAPASGLAIYTHFSRVAGDPTVWEGILAIYLPGDELLVSRSFAAAEDPQVADAGALRYACVHPGERWRLEFNGLVRGVSTSELADGLLADGHAEPLRLALDVTGIRPQWAVGHVPDGQSWGSFHVEQECRVAGELEIDGESVAVDTLGIRDHSRGVRKYDTMASECWSHGFFPSGRSYAAVHLENDEGPDLVAGFYFDGDTLHEVTRIERPELEDPRGEPRAYEVMLGGEFGDVLVQGRLDHACPFTLDHPIGQPIGFDPGDLRGTLIVEGPATPTLQGEPGFGWLERVARASALSA